MTITLSLGDFLMIAAIVLIFSRGAAATFSRRPEVDLRMQRQFDAIMKHLDLQEPAMSRPGALSQQVLAFLRAGDRIEAIKLYRQETGADLRQARAAIDQEA